MNLEDRDKLRSQVMRHEGLRLKPYRDSVGKLTIGYGRNLDDKGIAIHEAAYLLSGDIQDATLSLVNTYPWFESLDSVRQAVLINLCFNLGPTKLAKFHATLQAIAAKQWGEASDHMLDSLWAQQVGHRATELAAQMRTGAWQV